MIPPGRPPRDPNPRFFDDGQPNPEPAAGPSKPRKRRHRLRWTALSLVLLLVLMLVWPIGLYAWANGKLQHVDALSGAAPTPGTTYLIAGSDSRLGANGTLGAGTSADVQGARSDTIMILNVPVHGRTSLMSIPRDSYVNIPGYGMNKINAAYGFGGPKLLVKTIEQLTGLTIDHYVQIQFDGVVGLVDAVGGVNVCYNANVNDKNSGMVWTAGCHDVNGTQALAFSRMRDSDPLGDIGRTARQRQVVNAVLKKLTSSPSKLLLPSSQLTLLKAGINSVQVDTQMSLYKLMKFALALKQAEGANGATGTPSIANAAYWTKNAGEAVELDPVKAPQDFKAMADGSWTGNSTTAQ